MKTNQALFNLHVSDLVVLEPTGRVGRVEHVDRVNGFTTVSFEDGHLVCNCENLRHLPPHELRLGDRVRVKGSKDKATLVKFACVTDELWPCGLVPMHGVLKFDRGSRTRQLILLTRLVKILDPEGEVC